MSFVVSSPTHIKYSPQYHHYKTLLNVTTGYWHYSVRRRSRVWFDSRCLFFYISYTRFFFVFAWRSRCFCMAWRARCMTCVPAERCFYFLFLHGTLGYLAVASIFFFVFALCGRGRLFVYSHSTLVYLNCFTLALHKPNSHEQNNGFIVWLEYAATRLIFILYYTFKLFFATVFEFNEETIYLQYEVGLFDLNMEPPAEESFGKKTSSTIF